MDVPVPRYSPLDPHHSRATDRPAAPALTSQSEAETRTHQSPTQPHPQPAAEETVPSGSAPEDLIRRAANDLGGLPADPLVITDHELLPWEKRCHALLDVLDQYKIVNTEEKRRGIDDLGSEIYARLTYYEKWIVSASNVLMQKGVLTPDEIAQKVEQIKAQHAAQGATSAPTRTPGTTP